MFNLTLPSARNLARVLSSSAVTSQQDSSLSERKAAGPSFRSVSVPSSTGEGGDPFEKNGQQEDDVQNCDPLVYRLQHQKRYIQEKEKCRRPSKRRSPSGRTSYLSSSSSNRDRDPFDLWGSLTSEEGNSRERYSGDEKSSGSGNHKSRGGHLDDSLKSAGSHVDVTGWDSPSRKRRSSIMSDVDDLEEVDDSGLVVDFGGLTAMDIEKNHRRRRSTGIATPDNALHVDFGGIIPKHSRRGSAPHDMNKFLSSPNSSTLNSAGDEKLHDKHQSPWGAGKYAPQNKKSPSFDDDRSNISSCPTHADLENILSSLEVEALSSSEQSATEVDGARRPQPSTMVTTQSCTSSLSSPTEKCFQSVIANLPAENLNIISVLAPSHSSLDTGHVSPWQHDRRWNGNKLWEQQQQSDFKKQSILPWPSGQPITSTSSTPPQLHQKKNAEEEEDPRLVQLRQQTTDELRSELPKMQAQSKTNLEKSWAETERKRVENSKLDTQLAEMRQKLAMAQTAVHATSSVGSSDGCCSTSSRMNNNENGSTINRRSCPPPVEFCPSSQRPCRSNRWRTISNNANEDIINDISSQGGGDSTLLGQGSRISQPKGGVRRTTSVKGLVDRQSKIPNSYGMNKLVPVGKSFKRSSSNHSADVINALMGSKHYLDAEVTLNDGSRWSGNASRTNSSKTKFRRIGFLAGLEQSFRNMKPSSGCSLNSTNFDVSFSYDNDESSTTASRYGRQKTQVEEYNYPVFQTLTSGSDCSLSIPQSIQTLQHRKHAGDDGGVSNGGNGNVNEDDGCDVRSIIFHHPEKQNEDDDDIIATRSSVLYLCPATNKDWKYCDTSHSLFPTVDCSCSVCGFSEMEDFDFDPLNQSTEPVLDDSIAPACRQQERRNSSKPLPSEHNEKPREKADGLARCPSLMGLSEFDCDENEAEYNIPSPLTTPHTSGPLCPPQQEEEDRALAMHASILVSTNQIEKLVETIWKQEESIKKIEAKILEVNSKCDKSEEHFAEEESKLRLDVEELEALDLGIESKLECAEGLEQTIRGRHDMLREELVLINENKICDKNGTERECSEDVRYLGEWLRSFRREYDTSQENAIQKLSGLLDEFDSMQIPKLQGEDLEEGDDRCVSDDIIARFENLTDREEELVDMLDDVDCFVSCQSSFKQIHLNIETTIYLQNKLGDLESNLRSHLATIRMLIKQEGGGEDEGTNTTESSTASERLSLERAFVEAVISHLESVKQKQGKLVLDALSESVQLLMTWDEALVPNVPSLLLDAPASTSAPLSTLFGSSNLDKVSGIILKAKAKLAEVKLYVQNERAKFQAKMRSAGITTRSTLENRGHVKMCNFNINTAKDSDQGHNDNEQLFMRETEKEDEMNNRISLQLSVVQTLLSECRSLVRKHTHSFDVVPQAREALEDNINFQLLHEILEEDATENRCLLKELEEQISTATTILSEKETLLNKFSSELGSLQAQAREDSRANSELTNEIETEIKHILSNLSDEKSWIDSLQSLCQEKRERVSKLESLVMLSKSGLSEVK